MKPVLENACKIYWMSLVEEERGALMARISSSESSEKGSSDSTR